jgi:hypothetical protein
MIKWLIFVCLVLAGCSGRPQAAFAQASTQTSKARVESALVNVATLIRPGQRGYATFWDGNKYIQCSFEEDRSLRCEAAGTLMQPSLAHVLVAEKLSRLAALGWQLDPSFGNFVRVFPAGMETGEITDQILQTLSEVYDAHLADLEILTQWLKREPCPPRNGFTQNLAGMINDAPAMKSTAVHACAFMPKPGLAGSRSPQSLEEQLVRYGRRVKGEIQRLRVNLDREHIFVVFDTHLGYVQCAPSNSPPAIYCEAQSADSWPELASVLTAERVALLHKAGFVDPGRAPNYSKIYPAEKFDDAAIATELLTVLHDVYGYSGATELEVATE